jgi:hypothetical protein
MSVWSDHTEPFTPRFRTPGPTSPRKVVLISGATSPWFHASPPDGSLTQDVPQEAEPLLSQKSVLPNSVTVGVRFGSPVIMCSRLSSTGSAS